MTKRSDALATCRRGDRTTKLCYGPLPRPLSQPERRLPKSFHGFHALKKLSINSGKSSL
jgi:hypothetical protein